MVPYIGTWGRRLNTFHRTPPSTLSSSSSCSGALADGRTLKVFILEKPKPPPAPQQASRGIPLKGSNARQANGQALPSLSRSPLQQGASTSGQSARAMLQQQDVDMSSPSPAGVR